MLAFPVGCPRPERWRLGWERLGGERVISQQPLEAGQREHPTQRRAGRTQQERTGALSQGLPGRQQRTKPSDVHKGQLGTVHENLAHRRVGTGQERTDYRVEQLHSGHVQLADEQQQCLLARADDPNGQQVVGRYGLQDGLRR